MSKDSVRWAWAMGGVRVFIKIYLGRVELTITGQMTKEC